MTSELWVPVPLEASAINGAVIWQQTVSVYLVLVVRLLTVVLLDACTGVENTGVAHVELAICTCSYHMRGMLCVCACHDLLSRTHSCMLEIVIVCMRTLALVISSD